MSTDSAAGTSTNTSTEMMDWLALGQPDQHHEMLKDFAGEFKAEVRLWCGGEEPQITTGRMKNTFILDGRFLEQDYRGDATDDPMPAYVGRGFWGYNRITNAFEGVWIDNMATAMMTEKGEVDAAGREWHMRGTFEEPGSGATRNRRSVIRLIDRDHHVMEMYMDDASGKEVKSMEIHYERI